MNHLLGPYACRRPHWWSPRRRGRRTRARNIPGRNFSMAPKNIQMAAMDSPLFGYVVFYFLLELHLVEETFVAQKKCAYYQSGTQFSIKTLSSTNVWLTWIKCMVCTVVAFSPLVQCNAVQCSTVQCSAHQCSKPDCSQLASRTPLFRDSERLPPNWQLL